METVVLFDNFDLGPATCAVMNGDFTHLHNRFLGEVSDTQVCDEIDSLVKAICEEYEVEEWATGDLPDFPSEEFYTAIKNGAKVIITGCLP